MLEVITKYKDTVRNEFHNTYVSFIHDSRFYNFYPIHIGGYDSKIHVSDKTKFYLGDQELSYDTAVGIYDLFDDIWMKKIVITVKDWFYKDTHGKNYYADEVYLISMPNIRKDPA